MSAERSSLNSGSPFAAEAAAEADDGGLADGGARGDVGHGGVDEPFGIGQGAFAHFAFGGGQFVQGFADAV